MQPEEVVVGEVVVDIEDAVDDETMKIRLALDNVLERPLALWW